MIDEDFRTLLAAQLPNGTLIEKGKISEEQLASRVYYQMADSAQDVHLGGQQGLTETSFDIEVAVLSPDGAGDASAQTLAASIKSALNGYPYNGTNTIASTGILGIFIADHADDYQPRGVDADDGYFVAAFQARVHHL